MGSPDGAKAAATLYSLIETAKLNDVNPEGYLKYVLEHTLDAHDPALMEKLRPWNAKIDPRYTKPSLKPKDTEPTPKKPPKKIQAKKHSYPTYQSKNPENPTLFPDMVGLPRRLRIKGFWI